MKHLNYAIALGGLCALTGAGSAVKAQVSLYEFEQSVQPYTEISAADGGYSLGTPTYWPPVFNERSWADPSNLAGSVGGYLNAAQGPGFPIGFDFSFNGDVFDRVGISNSGFISFGKSSDGSQAVWIYAINHDHGKPFVQSYGGPEQPYKRNRVAGWAASSLYTQDMSPYVPPGPISSLRIATIGTAPNRVCVVQWKDYMIGYPPVSTRANFQIRLNESDQTVDVQYGQMLFGSTAVQVGLGGRVPEDFNSRQTVYEEPAFLYDWNTTVRGEANTSTCAAVASQVGQPNGSGVPPAVGLNFRWSPPACAPPAWPVTFSSIAFDGVLASWPANGSEAYDYFVSTENDINGPEAGSGTVNDAEVYIEGLDPMTTYYVFVRSYCDGEPGTWSTGSRFKTHGGGYLACPGTPMQEDFCTAQHNTYYWHYVSADGFSPVKIDFTAGYVGFISGESFGIWNGSSATGAPAFQPGSGDLAGQSFTSTGPQIFIRYTTVAGACEAQPWYLPLKWQAGCKNCTDPLVNYNVVPDCENNEFSVEVDVFSMGTTTTLLLQNSLGVAQTEANGTGLHTVGPFAAGTGVTVTAVNGDNAMCYSVSPAMITPCAVVDCGPTEHTLCYGDNTWIQRAYQGSGGQEIGIRFLAGSIGFGDNARTYNGADPEEVAPTPLPSVALNTLVTSGAPSTDHTLVLELVSDNSHSCLDEDPLYGTSTPWRYIVACYDGCVQPQATFTRTCLSQTQFEVAVNITVLGNTSSVVINNNGGAASVTATSIGTYTVGPFTAGTPVTLDVVGASVLCTWTSPAQNPDCSTIGIDEIAAGRMQLYPNPTEGAFRVELPTDMTGRTELQVLDLAGRVVAQEVLNTPTGTTLDLGHLPNGLYTVVAFGSGKRVSAKVGIQH